MKNWAEGDGGAGIARRGGNGYGGGALGAFGRDLHGMGEGRENGAASALKRGRGGAFLVRCIGQRCSTLIGKDGGGQARRRPMASSAARVNSRRSKDRRVFPMGGGGNGG